MLVVGVCVGCTCVGYRCACRLYVCVYIAGVCMCVYVIGVCRL